MKLTQTLLCSLVTMSLMACSSGGGSTHVDIGGNNPTPTPNTPNNSNNPNTPNNPNNPSYQANGSNNGITSAVAQDKTLYSLTHSWKVQPPTSAQMASIQAAVANTNKLRAEVGLPALKYDERLSAYAQRRAEEIVRSFAHQRLNGQDIWKGVQNGYRGENLAAGNASADDTVLTQWRQSAGHYANMVNKNYTKIGVGLVYVPNSKYGYYWVQIFGSDATTSRYYFDTSIAETSNPQPLQSVLVDGVHIPLTAPQGNWTDISANGYSGKVNGYSYTRFGVLQNNKVGVYQTFYQGTPTADMPQTGKAEYTGQAVVVDGNKVNTQLAARFDVDFGRKTLAGALTDSSGQAAVNLNANITGNTFHSTVGADVETHGGFFGSDASELAGDFRDYNSNKTGAYGARKR